MNRKYVLDHFHDYNAYKKGYAFRQWTEKRPSAFFSPLFALFLFHRYLPRNHFLKIVVPVTVVVSVSVERTNPRKTIGCVPNRAASRRIQSNVSRAIIAGQADLHNNRLSISSVRIRPFRYRVASPFLSSHSFYFIRLCIRCVFHLLFSLLYYSSETCMRNFVFFLSSSFSFAWFSSLRLLSPLIHLSLSMFRSCVFFLILVCAVSAASVPYPSSIFNFSSSQSPSIPHISCCVVYVIERFAWSFAGFDLFLPPCYRSV